MKPAAIYKPLRDELKTVLKSLGLSRVKSSPPSYSRPGGYGHVCLWFKLASGGWDRALGGRLTGALQSAEDPSPGTEWMPDPFASERIWQLLDDPAREQALAIHNTIVARFSRPPENHWLFTMKPGVVDSTLGRFNPVETLPAPDSDFWFQFFDAEDVSQWARFLSEALPRLVESFEFDLPPVGTA